MSPWSKPRRRASIALAVSLLSLGGCGPAQSSPTPSAPATVPSQEPRSVALVSQAPRYPGDYDSQTSQVPSSGAPGAQTYDDFALGGGGTIATVTWQGLYCATRANQPVPGPTATSFFVGFYADKSGAPDPSTQLNGAIYAVAETSQTLVSIDDAFRCGGGAGSTGAGVYNYSVALRTPFVTAPATRYWISLGAITPDFNVFWGWNSGAPGNRSSLQIFNAATAKFGTDRAFSLLPK
jgi:hypothetical protein